MRIEHYFDLAKERLDLSSDAALGRQLGMLPQEIIKAKRKGHIRSEVLEQLSQITGASMEELVLAREADKAHSDGLGEVWARAYEKVRQAGATAMIGAVAVGVLGTLPGQVEAAPQAQAPAIFITGIILIYGFRRFFLSFFLLFDFSALSPRSSLA